MKDKSVTTISADGLTKTVQLDVNGSGTFAQTDTTVTAVDGSKTETLTFLNPSTGALVRKDVLTTSADGRTVSLQRDTNGDGIFDHFETSVVNTDGSTTDTIWDTNSSGTLLDKTVTTTSADGLTKAVQMDTSGAGVFNLTQTTTTVLNADGSQTVTLSDFRADGSLEKLVR